MSHSKRSIARTIDLGNRRVGELSFCIITTAGVSDFMHEVHLNICLAIQPQLISVLLTASCS